MYGVINIEEPKNIGPAVISRRRVLIRSVRGIMIGARKLVALCIPRRELRSLSVNILYSVQCRFMSGSAD